MSEVHFLPAALDDLAEILAVHRLAFYPVARFHRNFRLRPLMLSLADLESAWSSYVYIKGIDPQSGDIVASARGRVVGTEGRIESVVVHPAWQRRGLGRRLMHAIEAAVAAADPCCRRFVLFTGRDTPGNVAFYQSLGYGILRHEAATAHEPDLVWLSKELS